MIDTRKLTRWYDLQAPFYRLWRNRFDSAPASRVVEEIASLPRRALVLDAGCGTGLVAIAIARTFPDSRVVGADLSEGMLRVARAEARRFKLSNTVVDGP